MRSKIYDSSGFTLVELILTIAILGVLAVSFAPSFTNLLSSSSQKGGRGTGGKIQSAINIKYTENVANNTTPFWPAVLDGASNAACSVSNPCFGSVLQPITSGGWSRSGDTTYVYSNAGVTQTYTYDPVDGTFECTGGSC